MWTVTTIEEYKNYLMNKLVELEKLDEQDLVLMHEDNMRTLQGSISDAVQIAECFSLEFDRDNIIDRTNKDRHFAHQFMEGFANYQNYIIDSALEHLDAEIEEGIVGETFGDVLQEFVISDNDDCENEED